MHPKGQSKATCLDHINGPTSALPKMSVLVRVSRVGTAVPQTWQRSSVTEEPEVPEAPSGSGSSLQPGLDVQGGVFFSRGSATLTKSSLRCEQTVSWYLARPTTVLANEMFPSTSSFPHFKRYILLLASGQQLRYLFLCFQTHTGASYLICMFFPDVFSHLSL